MRKDLIKFIIFVLILIGTLGMIVKQSVQNEPLKVVFFGDSITQFGWENQNGYVQQVVERLTNSGVNILPIPAGICGHTSKNMLDRMDKDVLAKKPDIMFFMGGLNDIWLNKGTFEDYKENIVIKPFLNWKYNCNIIINRERSPFFFFFINIGL